MLFRSILIEESDVRKLKKLDFSFIYVFSMINLILKDFFFNPLIGYGSCYFLYITYFYMYVSKNYNTMV